MNGMRALRAMPLRTAPSPSICHTLLIFPTAFALVIPHFPKRILDISRAHHESICTGDRFPFFRVGDAIDEANTTEGIPHEEERIDNRPDAGIGGIMKGDDAALYEVGCP